ncbi:non-homologous end-joining DNA ligase [Flavobacteriaceae bacterium TK19130]|nr:non-homologous end-joining DNA ligase [Thermobacterium salinum]
MKSLKQILSEKAYTKCASESFPGFVSPMLATLTDDYFDDEDWIYERKLDGVRTLVTLKDGVATLWSRNDKKLSNSYPEIVEAFENAKLPNLIIDGEIVAFEGNVTSFSKLQNRMQISDPEKARNTGVKVYIYIFDILYYDSYDLTELSLLNRKKVLREVMPFDDPIRYTSHRKKDGIEFHKEACKKGWEGIIAKDSQATYVHSRSKKWLKFKCSKGQELVIGGFTEPEGERVGFGAMLVGYYEEGVLHYAGKVGTGFDDAFLQKWRKKFDAISRKTSPFENFDEDNQGKNHWISPKYVGEFGFTEWTNSNKLRHPRFLGMRKDKAAKEVTKEEPT